MAGRLDIDQSSIFDNEEERQVEFAGEVDGDEYDFAVQYDVLEALNGDPPEGDALDLFNRLADPIADAALTALARDGDATTIVVSENDLG